MIPQRTVTRAVHRIVRRRVLTCTGWLFLDPGLAEESISLATVFFYFFVIDYSGGKSVSDLYEWTRFSVENVPQKATWGIKKKNIFWCLRSYFSMRPTCVPSFNQYRQVPSRRKKVEMVALAYLRPIIVFLRTMLRPKICRFYAYYDQ